MTTPLIRAAARGDPPEFVRFLVGEGHDVNQKDEYGQDALMHAAFFGHLDVVEVLLACGADVNARNNRGCTALMAATQNGHGSVARLLVEHGADVNAIDEFGFTPLMIAASRGDAVLAEFLVGRGADVNRLSPYGTALDMARAKGHNRVVEVLQRVGAWGKEDLFEAAKTGRLDLLTSMVEQGFGVDTKNDSGETPLMWAALFGKIDVVRYLLDKGAQVDERSNTGWTALMCAVAGDELEVAQLLLARGADPNVSIRDWEAFVLMAPQAIETLYSQGPEALINGSSAVVSEHCGVTPLMKAAELGNADMVKVLLDHGADPRAKTARGETAADFARQNGHGRIVEMLPG